MQNNKIRLHSAWLYGSVATGVLACTGGAEETRNERPNILFIMSDDHAYQAISSYDNRLIQTPNIDRIGKEGVRFTNSCVTNSISAPSRAVILTGKHSHLNGKIDNNSPFDTTQMTFPQLLQKEGYQTAMFGKLHFGNSPKGFDQFKILPGQGSYYNPDFITKYDGKVRVKGYVTDIITEMTIDWLENGWDTTQPFFLASLHKAPHREWLPAQRHFKEFTQKKFPEPVTLFDDYEGRGTAAKTAEMNLLKHMNWSGDAKLYPEMVEKLQLKEATSWGDRVFGHTVGRMDEAQRAEWDKIYRPIGEAFVQNYADMSDSALMRWRFQRYMQDYLGCIAAVDESVGKILDYLDQRGIAENTVVIYTSDQGFYLGEHGWFDKRFAYNESFKTPLLVRWSKEVPAGQVNTQMVQNLDFAPTLLSMAGITPPEDMQGENIIPLLKGNTEGFRDAVYYHYYEYPSIHMVKRHYAIITEEYKLIHFYYDVDEWELFDRQKDPLELTNEYDNPAYAETVKKLKKQLADLRIQYKDSEELDKKFLYNK